MYGIDKPDVDVDVTINKTRPKSRQNDNTLNMFVSLATETSPIVDEPTKSHGDSTKVF